ncbi:type II toxin-antitoxin system RelE/ParE family toxin [Pseudoduganella sp. R-43]|uniref:type II toxin-antitoxin system RelE/ParE family toxin n=1 Tax=Pseudoduganella sp. R-43 TaxID=3404063 RepID=UPI003CECCE33
MPRDCKRVFKTKTFDHWARKVVGDVLLCIAAREIEAGQFEADLGPGLCKKHIATHGHGKRGALRTLVAKRHSSTVIFLPRCSGIAAKSIADTFHRQSLAQLEQLAMLGE